jgi:hypothetical protein
MAIKELKTRIALKYDSYSAWTTAPGKDLVLLKGELGICYIGDTTPESHVVPTVLFKVGDGTKTFEALPWASAKAADVYNWAKASEVKRDGKKLVFVGGVVNADGTRSNLEVPFDYVTLAEVKEITDDLTTRIAAVEAKFQGDASVEGQISALDERLDVLEGEGAGSVKKAEADAKAYAKEYADGLAGNYDASGSAAAAETAAKAYADAEVAKDRERLGELETADAAQDTLISNNAAAIKEIQETTIPGVVSGYEAADLAINNKIGTADDDKNTATVYGAIAKAKADAAEDAAAKVSDLVNNGQVATNTTNIAGLTTRISDEETARANADAALNTRLEKVEAFFVGAAEDEGEGENLKNALDTLKEIQEFATGEGTAAQEMLDAIDANAKAITAIQDIVKDGGTLDLRVDDLETRASAVEGRAKTLEDIVDGYTTKGSIATAIEAAATKGQTGIDNAATAQAAAEAAAEAASVADGKAVQAQKEVDALELVVDGVKDVADQNKVDLAALTGRVDTAEADIDALEAIVVSGDDSNDKLRTAITSLQELTSDASKGNAKLRSDLDELAGKVNDTTTGLAATKTIADNAADQAETNRVAIAAITEDYVKASDLIGDFYIFNCGTATTVNHVMPTEA